MFHETANSRVGALFNRFCRVNSYSPSFPLNSVIRLHWRRAMKRRKGRKYKGTYLSTFDLKIERACEFTECVNSSVARFARKFLSTFPRQQLLCSKARSEFQEELTQKLSSKPRDQAIDALCSFLSLHKFLFFLKQ